MNFAHSILLIAAEQATHPATDAAPQLSPAAQSFVLSVNAVGLVVLAMLILRRLVRPDKLWLRGTPGRANSLRFVHVLALFGCYLLLSAAMMQAAETILGAPAGEGEQTAVQPMLLGGALTGLATLAVALGIAHMTFAHGLRRGLGLTARRWIADSVRGLLAGLAVLPVCSALALLGAYLVPEQYRQLHPILEYLHGGAARPGWLALGAVVAVVQAPIVEEVMFRGIIQSALRRWLGSPWLAVLGSSLLFMAVHVHIRPEPPYVAGLESLAPLFVLAVVLGYNYERTGRLWPSIVIHGVFNAVNVIAAVWG